MKSNSGRSSGVAFVLFLAVAFILGFNYWVHGSIEEKNKKQSEMTQDPTVHEIGWREVLKFDIEPLSGTPYYEVSIFNNTNITTSIRRCWVGPQTKGEDYTRGNPKTGGLDVYVFSRVVPQNQNVDFFCLRNAIFLRKDK